MSGQLPNAFIVNDIAVYFKHTDYHGFIHPYNFYEWTSYAREAFFRETVPNFQEVLSRRVKMMTVKISLEVYGDSSFGDKIQMQLTVGKIKRVSFDMLVEFYSARENKVLCKSTHTIVFANEITGRFASIPEEMQKVIIQYPAQYR